MTASTSIHAVTGKFQKLRPVIQKLLEISGCAGASVGVMQDHNVVWTDNFGYSNVEQKRQPTEDTLYCVGSLTKAFTATAAARQVHEGKIDWSTPVKDILPGFNQRNAHVREMTTIVDLMSHRIGLSNFVPFTLLFQGDGDSLLPKSQMLPTFEDMRLIAPFRADWNYFIWGHAIVGEIIRQASGRPLADYLKESIFDPLGMHSSTLAPSTLDDPSSIAIPYSALSDGTPFRLPHRQELEGTILEASGGVYSSIHDMLLWANANLEALNGDDTFKAHLPNIDVVTSNHIAIANPSLRERSYGLGWIRTQTPNVIGLVGDAMDVWSIEQSPTFGLGPESQLMIYHQGSTVGYYSAIMLFPETRSAVVVLTNSEALNDTADWISRAFAETLFDVPSPTDYIALAAHSRDAGLALYKKLEQKLADDRIPGTTPLPLQTYVGRYQHPKYPFHIEIVQDPNENQLQLRFQSAPSHGYELRHYHHDTFEWSLTRDQCARRGRYNWWEASYFKFHFVELDAGCFNKLVWNIDPDAPEPEVFLRKASQ